jgi:hypothetical protein
VPLLAPDRLLTATLAMRPVSPRRRIDYYIATDVQLAPNLRLRCDA